MRKKKLLKLKDEKPKKEKKKLRLRLKEKLSQNKFFYKTGTGLKSFKEWFDNLSNTTIIITVLIVVVAINVIITKLSPQYAISAQNLSEVKAKGIKLSNRHVYYALWLYITTFIIRIWAKYAKKPTGNVAR